MTENVKNLFRLKKESEEIKDRIIRDVKKFFELEEDYYKPVMISNFHSNNYIEYESNGDRNKTLSIREYLDEIKPYLKHIIYNLKKFDTWKIQLTIAINFISSKDTYEEQLMHSNSGNIETINYDKAGEVIKELFGPLLPKYQIDLEESMKGADFIFVDKNRKSNNKSYQ